MLSHALPSHVSAFELQAAALCHRQACDTAFLRCLRPLSALHGYLHSPLKMAETVKSAAEGVESGARSVAESVRGTLGDGVANAVRTGGEYGKSGIIATGNALGFKEGTGQDAADAAQSNLSGAGEELKAAAKDARAAFSEAGDRAHVDGHRNKEGAKAEAQSSYDAAVQNTKSAYESAKQSTADALNQGADKLQSK